MKILHVIPKVGPESFGLGPVALNLTLEQIGQGVDASIWSQDSESGKQWASETSGLQEKCIRIFPATGYKKLYFSPTMEHAVTCNRQTEIDVVHQHGIWTGISRVTNKFRKENGSITVISPHGSLEPWCLNVSRFKKKMASTLYETKNLNSANCIHACSDQELISCRQYGLKNPIAIIPNGIPSSWLSKKGESLKFKTKYNIASDKRVFLFISRIHPKKGLLLLLEAIKQGFNSDDFLLVIAGVDEGGHENELKNIVLSDGLSHLVKFVGPLFGDDKVDAFAAADIFILPTLSENFGIVVIEALSAGVPVITTKGAPWKDLDTYDCGWWTDISVHALAAALLDALQRSPRELKTMGERGRALVLSKYTWRQSALMTIEMYNWLLGRGGKPEFVITD
jgi:glycosyltransferase involved in cell wall biosynthesis